MNNEILLKFLGSDAGFGEKNNSAYYEKNDEIYIIDCGFTVFQEIRKKIDFSKYEKINIIITHLHNDHAGSLSQVILLAWFVYNKKVTVISKCENIEKYLEITGTTREAYEVIAELNNLKFIKTQHVKELDCYGFEWIVDGKKIVYTGDTYTLEPYMESLENADELYTDISKNGGVHLKLDDCYDQLKNIKQNGTNVILMHIDDKKYIKDKAKNEFVIIE